jgi:biopolymer transport protein ExbB/TolQ
MWNQLAQSLQHGNPYVTAILLFAFLGTVFFFERLIMLRFVYNINFTKFLGNFKKTVQAEDLDRAINICKNASHTSLPKISLRALEAAERDPSTVRGTIEEETIEFLPKIESRLTAIPTISTIILLIGVLGTIDSLWTAFNSLAVLDTPEKQAQLTSGIASSLNPTAMSLLICIVLIAGHQFLRTLAIRLSERIHYGVTILHNLLVPAEVAAYVAGVEAAAPAPMAMSSHTIIDEAQPAASEGEADDNFDDASVEDIKDEEEII